MNLFYQLSFKCIFCVYDCFIVRTYYSNILDRILLQLKLALPMQSYNELNEFVSLLSSDEEEVLP